MSEQNSEFSLRPTLRPTGWEKEAMKKNIVVPDGMYQAAMKYQDSGIQCSAALEAALRWLSENPITPSQKEAGELSGWKAREEDAHRHIVQLSIREWQCRMFLAPPPEVPEEVKDLLLDESQERRTDFRGANVSSWARPFINEAILEAYRRGKESK